MGKAEDNVKIWYNKDMKPEQHIIEQKIQNSSEMILESLAEKKPEKFMDLMKKLENPSFLFDNETKNYFQELGICDNFGNLPEFIENALRAIQLRSVQKINN